MSAPKRLFKCCVLGSTNEYRSLHWLPPSELRTLWSFIVWGNVPENKSLKSPIRVGINTNASCVNVSSGQSKYVSRSLEFVEIIITSGTYKVCDSMTCETSYGVIFILCWVIHKRGFIMYSTIRWLTLKQSVFCKDNRLVLIVKCLFAKASSANEGGWALEAHLHLKQHTQIYIHTYTKSGNFNKL